MPHEQASSVDAAYPMATQPNFEADFLRSMYRVPQLWTARAIKQVHDHYKTFAGECDSATSTLQGPETDDARAGHSPLTAAVCYHQSSACCSLKELLLHVATPSACATGAGAADAGICLCAHRTRLPRLQQPRQSSHTGEQRASIKIESLGCRA